MSELTPRDHEFVDAFSGFFYDMFKAAGVTMLPVKSHERIRTLAEKFAKAIEWRAEHKAVEVIKLLQKAMTEAVVLIENDMNDLRSRVEALENEAATKRAD